VFEFVEYLGFLYHYIVAVCKNKEEVGGCKFNCGPGCFTVSSVSQECSCFVWMDITHNGNGLNSVIPDY